MSEARDINAEAARDRPRVDRFEHVRADPKRRRRGYGTIIFLAIVVFIVAVVDIALLDASLMMVVLGAYAVLALAAIVMYFTRRAGKRKKGDVDVSARVDLRCQHCGSVFQADLDRSVRHREAALSCPVCGIFSTLPGDGDLPVDVPVGGRPSKATPYVCTNCTTRVVIGTFASTPHHQVLWKGCPSCGLQGTLRLASVQARAQQPGAGGAAGA